MTEAMPFLQKAILLSYAPRSLAGSVPHSIRFDQQKAEGTCADAQAPSVLFLNTRVRTMTLAYVSAAAPPDLLNASMALAFSARLASIASFRSISFTFISRVVVERSFSSSFMVI